MIAMTTRSTHSRIVVRPDATTRFERLLRELLEATRRDEDVEVLSRRDIEWLRDDDLLVMDDATGDQWLVTVREVR